MKCQTVILLSAEHTVVVCSTGVNINVQCLLSVLLQVSSCFKEFSPICDAVSVWLMFMWRVVSCYHSQGLTFDPAAFAISEIQAQYDPPALSAVTPRKINCSKVHCSTELWNCRWSNPIWTEHGLVQQRSEVTWRIFSSCGKWALYLLPTFSSCLKPRLHMIWTWNQLKVI